MSATNSDIIRIIGGHIHLNTSYARTVGIILRTEREGAVQRVAGVHFGIECGSRSHRIESIGPHIGTDRRIIVENDQCLCGNGIASLHIGIRSDIEIDIALTMSDGVVNGQETHL